jgi:maleate cis-trans isomerase
MLTDPGARLAVPVARIGVILPTSNRLIEPQFQHYAPAGLGVHFERARITGRWDRPIAELAPEVARAALSLADVKPDLIVFNCTGTSMKEGREGDAFLLDTIRRETGVAALSTAEAVVEALNALDMRKLVLVTPYVQATNDHEIAYLRACGFEVVHDIALGLKGGDQYITVPPERWIELVLANDRAEADGFFLSCTNTTQIEAIEAIEQATGKPAVSSNQAVLWACINRLRPKLRTGPSFVPGRLSGLTA